MAPEERSEHLRLELDLLDGQSRGTPRRGRPPVGRPAILVLGPDPDLRAYIVHCVEADLGSGGVVEAARVTEALRILERRRVALLIAESDPPSPRGGELCRLAREAAANPELPVVLVVDHPLRPEEGAAYRALGASRVIAKPFNAGKLGDVLRSLLDGPSHPETLPGPP